MGEAEIGELFATRTMDGDKNRIQSSLESLAQYINQAFDVAGLTREWPERVEAVAAAKGGRIKK